MTDSTTHIDSDTALQLHVLIRKLPQEVRTGVLDALSGIKSPTQDNRKASMPYFKEKFGLALQPTLDKLIEDPTFDAVFLFQNFKTLKPMTLYLSIYQGWLWLIDYKDPAGNYKKLKALCEIKRTPVGFTIQRKLNAIKDGFKKPAIIKVPTGAEKKKNYREQVMEFLENGEEGKPFKLENLALKDEEIDALKASVMTLENVRHVIDHHSIKLIKLTEQQMKELKAMQQ